MPIGNFSKKNNFFYTKLPTSTQLWVSKLSKHYEFHRFGKTLLLRRVAYSACLAMFFIVLYRFSSYIETASPNMNTFSKTPLFESIENQDDICLAIAERYSTACPINMLPVSYDVQAGTFNCSFDLWKDTTYIPDAEMYRCLLKSKPTIWRDAATEYLNNITKLQFPSECDKPDSADITEPSWILSNNGTRESNGEYRTDPEKPKWNLLTFLNHGYGYNLYVFAWNAANHWIHGIPVLAGNSHYRFSDFDCGRGWVCALSTLSHCKVDDVNPANILVYSNGVSRHNVMSLDQACEPNGVYSMEHGRCLCNDQYIMSANPKYTYCRPYNLTNERHRYRIKNYERNKIKAIESSDDVWFANNAVGEQNPHATRHYVHFESTGERTEFGWLWYHAHSVYWLLRNAPLKPKLEAFRASLGLWDGVRYAAIHVRHGDSCEDRIQKHRDCFPLSHYIEKLRALEAEYGPYDLVFLATDDPRVIKDTKSYANEFQFVYQNMDRSFHQHESGVGVDSLPSYNQKTRVYEIVRDIWVLSHSHALVGSMTSSVMWLAYEIMVVLHGHYVPFASIDSAYGNDANVGRFTTQNQ